MHTNKKIRSFVTPDLLFCQQIQNLLAHFLQWRIGCFAGRREINRHISFDIAVFHDQDAVTQQQGFFHVVGDEQDRFSLVLKESQHHVLKVTAGEVIQRAERLVHENQFRIVKQRAPQGNPLGHAAGKLRGVKAGSVG